MTTTYKNLRIILANIYILDLIIEASLIIKELIQYYIIEYIKQLTKIFS